MQLFSRRHAVLLFALLIPALGACGPAAPGAQPAEGPANVLFVGNSFTYYNNSLHNHYRKLLGAARPGAELAGNVRIMTISGGRLPEHAGLPAMLDSAEWDVVILQGHSLEPLDDATAGPFREAARRYARQIRAAGAQPMMFMTWAYTGQPEMTTPLDAAYSGIGQEIGARVVPVGLAFETVTRERPDIALRIADARHPSLAGTYLAACTFYAALQGASPEGLAYDAGLGEETARYLQQVAWQTLADYRKREAG